MERRRLRLYARNFGAHAAWIRTRSCFACRKPPPSEPHHVVKRGMSGCGGNRRHLHPTLPTVPSRSRTHQQRESPGALGANRADTDGTGALVLGGLTTPRGSSMNHAPLMAGTKKCARCHEPKPVIAFAVDKTNSDGLYSWCRECSSQYDQARHRTKTNRHPRPGVHTFDEWQHAPKTRGQRLNR